MVEHVAEQDDELMEKYLMGEELTSEEIIAGIRKATLANCMVPVCCGTSYRNKGVQKLLDAIVAYMPSPLDIPAMKGVNPKQVRTISAKLLMMNHSQRLHLKLQLTHSLGNYVSLEFISGFSSAGGPGL